MRRFLNLLVCALVIFIGFTFIVGCSPKDPLVIKESDTYIVINVSNEQMTISNDTTLLDYMNSLKNDGELVFELNNGMVNSINGIANPLDWSSCWMLYTSDENNANNAWGTIEYKGKVYGSALFGAETLIVKDGYTYVWVFKSI